MGAAAKWVPQLEPGHRPPATPPPPPPRREARDELKPPAAFRIPASTVQLRHLRAAAIGDLHPDKTVPDPDRDRDRPARSPRPAMPDTIAEQLAHQQGGVIPAHPGNSAALTQTPRCIRRNIDVRRVTAMASRLNNPKSPRVTTPTPPHQANSSPYRTPRNVASAAIKPVSRTRSPCTHRAAATPTAPPGPRRAEACGRFRHRSQQVAIAAPQGRCGR